MGNSWKVVIIDDERLARNKLRSLLEEHTEIRVVGEADGVGAALRVIEDAEPDLLFLDVQMPGQSGFDLVNQIKRPVKIIFVTAFDEYAIRAFEINALDYLLKPINPDRLARAINRLPHTASGPDQPARPLEYDDFLLLPFGDTSIFLKLSAIKCICAAGVYSEVITTDSQKAMVLRSLNEWEARLPEKHFARIHRSTIVNLACVERIENWFNQSSRLFLKHTAEPFSVSRRYAARLRLKFG
jgi:two-component system, LytTR family, response regulator